jgi:hypothetical protein
MACGAVGVSFAVRPKSAATWRTDIPALSLLALSHQQQTVSSARSKPPSPQNRYSLAVLTADRLGGAATRRRPDCVGGFAKRWRWRIVKPWRGRTEVKRGVGWIPQSHRMEPTPCVGKQTASPGQLGGQRRSSSYLRRLGRDVRRPRSVRRRRLHRSASRTWSGSPRPLMSAITAWSSGHSRTRSSRASPIRGRQPSASPTRDQERLPWSNTIR